MVDGKRIEKIKYRVKDSMLPDDIRKLRTSEIAQYRLDIKYLLSLLAESQTREKAAVEDLSTYKDCGFCIHVQDQQYCYKNCQRHVDVDNFRTHPCWQWRGPQKGEPHETV